MSADERVRRALHSATPEPADPTGDWRRVVDDASRPRRRRLAWRVAAIVSAMLTASVLVLAAPFEDDPPATFFERALAAVGDGPVVHVVMRGDWGGAFLDLDSGRVSPVHGETEVWYDPERGLREIMLLGGLSQGEAFTPPEKIRAAALQQYQGLTSRYREALASNRARVVAEGEVGGRPVQWIRIHGEYLPDSADGKDHLFAHEVAVDRETYEPIYFRTTRDGLPGPRGSGETVVKLEFLPEGAGEFPRAARSEPDPEVFGVRRGEKLTVEQARAALGARALWLGQSFGDLPLAELRELLHEQRERPSDPWTVTRSVAAVYSAEAVRPAGFPGIAQGVTVEQAKRPLRTWRGAPANLDLKDGWAYVSGGSALVRHDGVYVSIQAATTPQVIEALGALRPIAGGAPVAPAVAREGAHRLALLVEGTRPQTKVSGAAPVPPRTYRPEGPAIQAGSAGGVSVRVFAPNIAVFDTSGMAPSVRRDTRGRSGSCFRTTHSAGRARGATAGASGDSRSRYVVRMLGLDAPYDACEIGGAFGRRWGSGRSWHAPVELALTAAGRRYFAERAAARELAYFVRSPAMSAVRRALKRETADAPAATALAGRFGAAAVGLAAPDAEPAAGKIGIWTDDDDEIRVTKVIGERVLFVELREGRIARTNAGELAFIF